MRKYIVYLLLFLPLAAISQVADSSKRKVKLEGALNFRDIGGYRTKDGKLVKWGRIYRSAEINNLTAADLVQLDHLGINYVFDFRGPAEVATAPDRIPAHATRVSLPYGSEDTGDKMKMMKAMSSADNGDSIMLPYYANISSFTKRYKPVFETLVRNAGDSAIVFHCTAGKDRTGIATALVLSALGVDQATIMADYLASNYYRQPDNERMKNMLVNTYHMKEEVVKDVLGVKEAYLAATFTAINNQYGSMENYLQKEMGLDQQAMKILKQKYLQ